MAQACYPCRGGYVSEDFLALATPDAIAREVDTGISPAFGEIAFADHRITTR